MPATAFLAFLVLVLTGCADSHQPAAPTRSEVIASASCTPEPLTGAPFSGESGVYRAGPLTLAVGEDLAQLPSRRRAWPSVHETIALITGDRPVVVRVGAASRARLSLQFHPLHPVHTDAVLSDGRTAVRFPACGGQSHRFGGGILFGGIGCARLDVQTAGSPPSSMLIPIGNSLRGCPTGHIVPLPSASLPFLGVACGIPNSIACERVGIGVTTEIPATLVVVQVAGRLVALSPPGPPQATNVWLGYLQGVSLRRGPLRIPIPRRETQWSGSPVLYPRVRVTAFFPHGQVATTTGSVLLHPGFG